MDVVPLLFPLIFLDIILIVVGIFAWLKTDHTNGPRWLWLCIIIFITVIGPILFFTIGRRQN